MIKTIGIMGCGWLGLPLAKLLVSDGYHVKGTTTTKGKQKILATAGIQPFVLSLSEKKVQGDIDSFLVNVDVLVINVPPKLRGNKKENYVKKMGLVYAAILENHIQRLIFVSSTSVYGVIEGIVTEDTMPVPATESGKQLLASEQLFREHKKLQTTILRFGGLIGPKRHPITMLSGKKGLDNGHAPVNLIHLDDCLQIIRNCIVQGWWNRIFNAVYPEHPSKSTYYKAEAKKRGLPPPQYADTLPGIGKIIHAQKLIEDEGYSFKTSIFC